VKRKINNTSIHPSLKQNNNQFYKNLEEDTKKKEGWCSKWTYILIKFSYRSTFPRPETPTVRVPSAESTLPTRSLNTRLVRLLSSPKVRDVTTVSNPVMVVKPSPFSTRRPRLPRRLSSVSNVPVSYIYIYIQLRVVTWIIILFCFLACKYKMQLALKRCKHFELGGDKKTKGAALVF
jgi:hypothetical protein